LLFAGFAEADLVSGAVNVFGFEGGGGHANEFGGALDVVLGQVDVSSLIAAVDTAGLTGEAN
jgi:hypothetical protein